MPKRESLYHRYPDYRVELEPDSSRVRLRWNGELLADSDRTVLVRETKHDPVTYIPREDVRMELLQRTSHQSFCPFKGEASYWSLRSGSEVDENAVWSYEDPFPEVVGLKDHLAFYADRVDWEREGR